MEPERSPLAARVRVEASADLPTRFGDFRVLVFSDDHDDRENLAIVRGDVWGADDVPVRLHSECLTGDAFGSLRCDCRDQLELGLAYVGAQPRGIVLYLRQEGRGIGLTNKIRAYALQQEQGLDTVEANLKLGFADDLRRYDVAAEMLRSLGVLSADLITNNPLKIAGLVDEGIPVRRRIPSRTLSNPLNLEYLKTKRDRSGHLIEFLSEESSEAKAG
jgi:GTP cyclohydrolase II/3,4-dihydroxy 2-butanone 4-phosphate synthase/GTP cyclohydrolase II